MSQKDPLNTINILTNRIRANEADYNLNRQTAKTSALALKEGLTDEEKKKVLVYLKN